MAATAHWVRAGEVTPMERGALGKLIASCPGHDLTTLDTPVLIKPADCDDDDVESVSVEVSGDEVAPAVVAAGEWQIDMPTDAEILQAVLEEMSTDSMRAMMQEHGSLETRGMRSEVMGKLAALLLPNEEWCAEQRERVRADAIANAKAEALSLHAAAKAAAAADLAHTRREIAWFQPMQVVQAMRVYEEEIDVLQKACVALGSLVLDAEHRERVVRAGGIDAIVAAMVAYPADEVLQRDACCALAHLSEGDACACTHIARAGGLKAVASAMRTFDSVLKLRRWGCAVLAHSLGAEEEDQPEEVAVRLAQERVEAIMESEGVGLLLSALTDTPKDAAIQRDSCAALAALAQHNETQRNVIVSRGAVGAALAAVSRHRALADVVAEACLLLSTLMVDDPGVKREFVDAEGITEICLALSNHKSEPWVQTQALTVLWVLMVDPAAIDPATGLVNGVHADYRRMVETAGGQEIAEAARVRFSGLDEEDPEESLLNASLMANESAWVQMPSLSLRPPSPEGQHGDDDMMRLIVEEWKDEQRQLNVLIKRAKALNHPGIDDERIATMQEHIDSERFTYSHFINMWSKRLEGLGVTIVRVPKGEEEQPSFMRDVANNKHEISSQRADSARGLSAMPPTEERGKDEAENASVCLPQVLERDDAVVRAAEGVLQKLHEGDPDPTRPWTAPVPMVKPEETIYLWNDEELMNHSATKRLELLSRVILLDEETAELRMKLVAAAAAGSNVGSTEGYGRGGEQAPAAQPLTRRGSEMSVENYAAAEMAAAEKIRQRLREIEEERAALPLEDEVTEAVKGELPPADPQTRPRAPSPSRKWKPPPAPPQLEPEPEPLVLGTELGAEECSAIEAEDGGWGQDDGRPETASGIVQAAAVAEIEDRCADSGGRQSPSFYTDEGELMPGLDATKERWKHELELEMLLASEDYKEMLATLSAADTQHLTEGIEMASRAGHDGAAADTVWYIEGAIAFKSEHPDVSFDKAEISIIDGIFRLQQRVETDEDEQQEERSNGGVSAIAGTDDEQQAVVTS